MPFSNPTKASWKTPVSLTKNIILLSLCCQPHKIGETVVTTPKQQHLQQQKIWVWLSTLTSLMTWRNNKDNSQWTKSTTKNNREPSPLYNANRSFNDLHRTDQTGAKHDAKQVIIIFFVNNTTINTTRYLVQAVIFLFYTNCLKYVDVSAHLDWTGCSVCM